MQRNKYVWFVVAVLCLVRAASAQSSVAIVSGNGQVVCNSCSPVASAVTPKGSFEPLAVRVTDANGNPAALGTTVTWTLVSGTLQLPTNSTSTDASGLSTLPPQFVSGTGGVFLPYVQNVVTATAGTGSATFYLTQGFADASAVPVVNVGAVNPSVGTPFIGTAGTQGTPSITVPVFSTTGPVPNVSIRLRIIDSDTAGTTISCLTGAGADPGSALSDSTGTAKCTPVFSGTPGSGHFRVDMGGVPDTGSGASLYLSYGPFPFTVNPGLPAAIQVTSTDPQSANPGTSVTVTAKVIDTSGLGLAGQFVTWKVTQGSATVTSGSTLTGDNGQTTNAINLAANATGQIKVTATVNNTSLVATFTVNANVIVNVSGLQIVSGNNQTAAVSTGFGQPLVVQVNGSNGQGVAGALVTFSASGPVGISSSSVTTGSNGQASVTATATGTTGNATVTASVAGFSQTFNLTVATPPPPITANSFYNGASFVQGSLSPCSIATIIAPGLAPGLQGFVSGGGIIGPLAYQVANDRVSVGNTAAPIYSVGSSGGQQQLTFQVPCETPAGANASVVVTTAGGGTITISVPIQTVSPGIFMTTSSDNVQRIVGVRPDGTFISPDNPARRGEIIRVFTTGMGPTVPAVGTNALPVPGVDALVQGTVVAGITNQAGQGSGLRVTAARAAPDLIGVFEVPVQIPNDAATGSNVSFSVAVIPVGSNTPVYSQTVKISVL